MHNLVLRIRFNRLFLLVFGLFVKKGKGVKKMNNMMIQWGDMKQQQQ